MGAGGAGLQLAADWTPGPGALGQILGQPPDHVLTPDDVETVAHAVADKLYPGGPFGGLQYPSWVQTVDSIRARLTPFVGKPIGTITESDLNTSSLVDQLVQGLGNVAAHGAILAGAVVLILLGAWVLFRD